MTTFKAYFYKGIPNKLSSKIFDYLVRHLDSGIYSHMELCFSDGVSASSSYMDGGVRFKQIVYDSSRWDCAELPANLEAVARAWFTEHEGKAYDIMGDLWQVFGFIRDDSDKFFCSAACMAALGYKDAWRFRPNAAYSVLSKWPMN